MKILRHRTVFSQYEPLDGNVIRGLDHRAPYADVVEGLGIDLHTTAQRLRGLDGQDMRTGNRARELQLLERQLVYRIDTAGCEGHRLVFLLVVVEVNLIEIHLAAPVME